MSTRLFDTHCHLDFDVFNSDLDTVISRAQSQGVDLFLIPGCGKSNWQKVMTISERYDDIYYALGLHPYYTDAHQENDILLLDELLAKQNEKCVAIGECGLDFVHNSEQERQMFFFEAQLVLANKYNLPVILHNRKAHQTMIKMLKRKKVLKGGVIHAFSGSYEQAMDFIKLGYYIGVGSSITYLRAKKTRKTISELPLDRLVLETDAPDMPLSGFQGQKNLPERVIKVLNELNVLRSESEQTVADQVLKNSKALFTICE